MKKARIMEENNLSKNKLAKNSKSIMGLMTRVLVQIIINLEDLGKIEEFGKFFIMNFSFRSEFVIFK